MAADIANHEVASREKWLEARRVLLAKEKALTRQRDELSRQRRELPWVKVEENYIFDGPCGKEALGDLFAGRSQLIVYHFMLGPGWEEGCRGCSLVADHIGGSLVHLAERDVTLAAVSRAPYEQIAAFRKRMGWSFHWVSSFDNRFNYDYRVSFTDAERTAGKQLYNFETSHHANEEAPGASAFYKDGTGKIFHTYSAYARGLENLIGAYSLLDLAPKGRDEEALPSPMAWVRHHDRYAGSRAACCSSHS